MGRKNLIVMLSISFLMLVLLDSCRQKELTTNIATIKKQGDSLNFKLCLDNNDSLEIVDSDLPWYKPKDGNRVIASYNIISKQKNGNYKIKLNDIKTVLTKDIYQVSPDTEDSIGNAPIGLRELWIAKDYLNIKFYYFGYNALHYINLVKDKNAPNDGKIYLQFRHNKNNDSELYSYNGIVSFNLKSLQKYASDTILNLVIEMNGYSGIITKEIKYYFDNTSSLNHVTSNNLSETTEKRAKIK